MINGRSSVVLIPEARGHHRRNRVDHSARARRDRGVVVVALAAGRTDVDGVRGLAGDLDPVRAARLRGLGPFGRRSSRSRVTCSMTMAGLPLTMPDDLELQRGLAALGDVPGRDVERLRRRHSRIRILDLVDLDAEAGRQLADRRPPRHAKHAGLQQHRRLIERPPEAHDVEHYGGTVIGGVVGDLHAPHLFDASGRCSRSRTGSDRWRIRDLPRR